MSTVIIVILLLTGLFLAASVVLGRTTHQVDSARDTEYLELEDSWIRYSVTGGGPPVVLVHGLLSSGRIWDVLAARLAQRFTVYTLDLRGFGDSDKPISGYGIRYGSRLLYAFCAHFGLTRAIVIGHDVGGAMAVKFAADHPDVVGRLVLVATPADEDQIDLPTLLWLATLPVIGPVFYTLGRFLTPLRRLWMRTFVLDPEDLTEEVVDDAGKSTPAALTRTLGVMEREISRGRLVRQAGIVKTPVLIIAGEDDQIVDPQAAEDWARTLPAEVVFLNECGHLPMLERPGEFNARILAFLTGDPRYLERADEATAEDVAGEGVEEPPEEESLPFTWAKPKPPDPGAADSDSPPATPEQADSPPARDSEDRSDVSSPAADRSAERKTDPVEEDGAGEPPQGDRARNRGDAVIPEVPEDLFEWPDALKQPRPWDRPREDAEDQREPDEKPDRQAREKSDEDADPEDPEKEGPGP